MSEDADISAINLREILFRVCKRARRLVDLESRRACLLAAQEPLPDVSDAERETLRAISGGQESLDRLRGDSRLAAIVQRFRGDAGEQVHKEESGGLKRSVFRQTALQVARDTFLNAAAQVVNGFTKPSSEENSDCWFAEYCCSVLDGKDARPQLLRAADILDTPDFREELLGKLWKECPEETNELRLPNPNVYCETDAPGRDQSPPAATNAESEIETQVGGARDGVAGTEPIDGCSAGKLSTDDQGLVLAKIPPLDKNNGKWVTAVAVARAGRALRLRVKENDLSDEEAKKAVRALKTARGKRRATERSTNGVEGIDHKGRWFRADPDDRRVFWYFKSTTDGKQV